MRCGRAGAGLRVETRRSGLRDEARLKAGSTSKAKPEWITGQGQAGRVTRRDAPESGQRLEDKAGMDYGTRRARGCVARRNEVGVGPTLPHRNRRGAYARPTTKAGLPDKIPRKNHSAAARPITARGSPKEALQPAASNQNPDRNRKPCKVGGRGDQERHKRSSS